MTEFKNIFIYVSDGLRYDHMPESVAEEGNVIPTLAPAGYTPISFSSMVTGLDPRKHNVRSFYDTLDSKTVFDLFDNHSYFDHPEDAMCKNVFKDYETAVEFGELDEPFIYIERALDTHQPYGEIKHGNDIPKNPDNSGDLEELYWKGVKETEEHFWSHVQQLKDKGLYEDTLVIFTSDHGEMLRERYLLRRWKGHNKPLKKELCVVPTVFLNYENDWDRMRTIDIIPTALSLAGKDSLGEGVDLEYEKPDCGYTMLQVNTSPLITTGAEWEWNGYWRRSSGIRSDIASLAMELIEPIRQELRHTWIADIFSSDVSQQRKFANNSEEELEDLEV